MKQEQKQLAEALYLKGELTQKQIAFKLGVTEKTVGAWVKPLKARIKLNNKLVKNMQTRLLDLLADDKTPIRDIKALAYSIDLMKRTP